jgi:hypothetical protein
MHMHATHTHTHTPRMHTHTCTHTGRESREQDERKKKKEREREMEGRARKRDEGEGQKREGREREGAGRESRTRHAHACVHTCTHTHHACMTHTHTCTHTHTQRKNGKNSPGLRKWSPRTLRCRGPHTILRAPSTSTGGCSCMAPTTQDWRVYRKKALLRRQESTGVNRLSQPLATKQSFYNKIRGRANEVEQILPGTAPLPPIPIRTSTKGTGKITGQTTGGRGETEVPKGAERARQRGRSRHRIGRKSRR